MGGDKADCRVDDVVAGDPSTSKLQSHRARIEGGQVAGKESKALGFAPGRFLLMDQPTTGAGQGGKADLGMRLADPALAGCGDSRIHLANLRQDVPELAGEALAASFGV